MPIADRQGRVFLFFFFLPQHVSIARSGEIIKVEVVVMRGNRILTVMRGNEDDDNEEQHHRAFALETNSIFLLSP